jgi:hypothetical protein
MFTNYLKSALRFLKHNKVFAKSFLIAAVVVLSTVVLHSFRTSRVNPVEALRYE